DGAPWTGRGPKAVRTSGVQHQSTLRMTEGQLLDVERRRSDLRAGQLSRGAFNAQIDRLLSAR
ncbi:hypothetical protein, partial [Bradyrhizobium sp. STM 3809]|uniref:hypothetical protein n=1 Tax=Bradyrhizobium sp. STM 3809 TaxID=551936 RepID=UPI001AEC3CE7